MTLAGLLTGWYNGPASSINKYWNDTAAWVANNHPAKPFIISETGAGGIVDAGVAPGSQHRVPAGASNCLLPVELRSPVTNGLYAHDYYGRRVK